MPLSATAFLRIFAGLLVLLSGASAASARAAGRNHDLQPMRLASASPSPHDYAPGPVFR